MTTGQDIVHEDIISAEVAQVYAAAATQAGIKGWWNTRAQVAETVGKESHMFFNKEGNEIEMVFRVDELKENARVAWTCTGNANPYWIGSKISFEMNATDEGTEFRFIHDSLNPDAFSPEMHAMIQQGWAHFMNSFKSWCETGIGQPWG